MTKGQVRCTKVQAERIDRESRADWATWLGLGDTWRDVLRRVEDP